MTARTTPLGAPGPRPLGAPGNGQGTPAGATSMTLGTLREVRNELAGLGDLLERMSKEMQGLRRAVEAVANREARLPDADPEAGKAERKAAKRAAKREAAERTARDEREAALIARVEKLERRVAKLKRRVDWLG